MKDGVAGMTDARRRIHELDGLRGILALLVCVFHFTSTFPAAVSVTERYLPLLRNGWFSVDVFFVLSGFVLAYVYGQSFRDGLDREKLFDFMAARVARLYPVHLVTLAALVVVLVPFIYWREVFQSPDGHYSWHSLPANLLMLQGPWVDHRTWNYPSWSISAEFHAYALFPLLVLLVRGTWKSIAALVLGVGIPLAIYYSRGLDEEFPTNGAVVLLRSLPLFLAGIGLYNLHDRLVKVAAPVIVLPIAAIPLLLSFQALAPLAVLSIYALIIGSLTLAPLQRFLQTRQAVRLGELSYSLYLVHALVQVFVLERIQDIFHPGASASVALVVIGAICALVAAYLLRRFVELPGRVATRQFLLKKRTREPAE